MTRCRGTFSTLKVDKKLHKTKVMTNAPCSGWEMEQFSGGSVSVKLSENLSDL